MIDYLFQLILELLKNNMQDISLKSFDRNPASINLNYNKIQQYKSRTGGFLSICYFIIALIIFVFKIKDLAQRTHLTYEQIVTKQNDLTPLNISSGKFRLFFLKVDQNQPFKINFTDQFRFGINVSIVEYNIYIDNQNKTYQFNPVPMVECQQQQYGNQSQYYFCSPERNQLNKLNYSIFGRVDFSNAHRSFSPNPYRQYSFIVQPCDKNKNDSCQQYQNNLVPFFQFDNDKITPNQISHENTINKSFQGRHFQTRALLQVNSTIDIQLDFQKIIIRTQNSILPSFFNIDNDNFQINQTWYFDEQINQFYSLHHSLNTMLNVQIRRSIYTREYVRKYTKLDFVLAQIFGLLGLFSGIIFFLYRGYNDYSLEQKIRKDLGLPYDKNTHIFRYYRKNILKNLYLWLSCCFQNNVGYLQQKKYLSKINKKLDVSTLKHQNFNRRILQYS